MNDSTYFKDWKVTVQIGNRVMVWPIKAPTKQAAHEHAELQLKHRGGNGKVIKVEEVR